MRIESVLSVIAIVLSMTSLGWQVASWKRSGPVVKVTAQQALITSGPEADWHTDVTARNTGRAPITVTGWGLRFPDGQTIVMMRNLPISAPLPYRLEAGAASSWYIGTDDLRGACEERGAKYQELRGFVRLADGRTIDARRRGIGLE
jgi:hypothetical protein